MTYYKNYREKEFIFQQDDASIHVSRQSRKWFSSENNKMLQWPNPIENLWGILVGKVYSKGNQYISVLELTNAIRQSWDEIETLQRLADSMPNRIFCIIQNKGGHMKY